MAQWFRSRSTQTWRKGRGFEYWQGLSASLMRDLPSVNKEKFCPPCFFCHLFHYSFSVLYILCRIFWANEDLQKITSSTRNWFLTNGTLFGTEEVTHKKIKIICILYMIFQNYQYDGQRERGYWFMTSNMLHMSIFIWNRFVGADRYLCSGSLS